MLSKDVLNKIFTVEAVESLIRDIDIHVDSLYVVDAKPSDRRQELESLRGQLRQLPILRLKIAFDPPDSIISDICLWARLNISPDAVLDVEIDPSLVAGAEISWAGRYVDLSKKTQLEEILLNLKFKIYNLNSIFKL